MRNWRAWLLFFGAVLVVAVLAYQFSPPVQIAVGKCSADPYIQGFHFREQAGFGAYRWSGPVASVSFRGIGEQAGIFSINWGRARLAPVE